MTDSYRPDTANSAESVPPAYQPVWVPTSDPHTDDEGSDSGGAAAKEEAAHLADSAASGAQEVAGTAADRAQEVTETAKEQVKDTAAEAKQQARSLLEMGREQVGTQAGAQQQRLASGLRSLSSELSTMADSSQQHGLASQVTRQLADSSDQIGSWLEQREPTQVIDEVAGYARRHPVAFMGIAAGLGLLVGRVVRAAKDATSAGGAEHGTGSASGSGSGSASSAEAAATAPRADSFDHPAHPTPDDVVIDTTTGAPR